MTIQLMMVASVPRCRTFSASTNGLLLVPALSQGRIVSRTKAPTRNKPTVMTTLWNMARGTARAGSRHSSATTLTSSMPTYAKSTVSRAAKTAPPPLGKKPPWLLMSLMG